MIHTRISMNLKYSWTLNLVRLYSITSFGKKIVRLGTRRRSSFFDLAQCSASDVAFCHFWCIHFPAWQLEGNMQPSNEIINSDVVTSAGVAGCIFFYLLSSWKWKLYCNRWLSYCYRITRMWRFHIIDSQTRRGNHENESRNR